MTTRSEPCGKAGLYWDIALGLGALVYVLLALFGGVDSPVAGLLVIVVVGRRLVQRR